MTSPNALKLARQSGRNVYPAFGEIGEKVFEEFELAFASKLACSTKFRDNEEFRSVQHLMLYWQTGYFKNALINWFQRCLPDGTCARETSLTAETLFGSITPKCDALVPPVFHKKEFCTIPELSALTESGESLEMKAHIFNEVLEHQLVGRSLIKFAGASEKVKTDYALPDGKDGLVLDGNTLYYTADTLFIVATHPLDSKTFSRLNNIGFLSRFHVLQYSISEDTMREIRTGASVQEGSDPDLLKRLTSQLKAENQKLWNARQQAMQLPDYDKILLPVLMQREEYIEGVLKRYDEHVRAKILSQLSHTRIRGNLTREIAAYKLLEKDASDEDIVSWAIGRIPHFYDFVLHPIIDNDYMRVSARKSIVEDALAIIKASFAGQIVKRGVVVEALEKQGFSRDTIDKALGAFKKPSYGVYEIS